MPTATPIGGIARSRRPLPLQLGNSLSPCITDDLVAAPTTPLITPPCGDECSCSGDNSSCSADGKQDICTESPSLTEFPAPFTAGYEGHCTEEPLPAAVLPDRDVPSDDLPTYFDCNEPIFEGDTDLEKFHTLESPSPIPAIPLPPTWSTCRHCAEGPWVCGEHDGQALEDDDGVIRCHVVPVDSSTPEYAAVVLPLVQHGVRIVDVRRVQNFRLYERYYAKEQADAVKPWETTGQDLWHGTSATDMDRLLLEGLDQRISARGHFGRGLYFSDHPGKAHRYTSKHHCSSTAGEVGIRTMLRCKVLLGKTKMYPPRVNDPSLLREPFGFDSVQGNISGQNEMIVYDNDRVLIDYVVRYTVSPPGAAANPVKSQTLSPSSQAAIANIADELKRLVSSAPSLQRTFARKTSGDPQSLGTTQAPRQPCCNSAQKSKRAHLHNRARQMKS